MEIIKQLSRKIDDELDDAEKYIKCAHKVKDEYPDLAETYYKLSLEEMKHMMMLHDQVVSIINNYKKDHEVPPGMQALYDYLHEMHIEKAAQIKAWQDTYK